MDEVFLLGMVDARRGEKGLLACRGTHRMGVGWRLLGINSLSN